MSFRDRAGARDVAARVAVLASSLSPSIAPLARVAYNLRWAWSRDGRATFEAIDPLAFRLSGENPVLFLQELSPRTMQDVEDDASLCARIRALADELDADLARPDVPRSGIDGPIAFLCSEFGVHRSLPIYSGGLGVLAGDFVKEASDRALPFVAVGLYYRRGYFHQRLDLAGWQHEYWVEGDSASLPMALVTGVDGKPLELHVPIAGREVGFRVFRVDVGRIPLFLLDTEIASNDAVDRWISTRLYESNRSLRLAQYALLGMGAVRVLDALGIEPFAYHLNEGHAALAAVELTARAVARGLPLDEARAEVRSKIVFTTHTPVPAGNETYSRDEFLAAFGGLPSRLGIDDERFLRDFRADPDDPHEPFGLTPFALRASRGCNGVSRLHGDVSRRMWQRMFPGRRVDEVPIGHVTNGVHVPSFLSPPMWALFDRHLGRGWLERSADRTTWEPVRDIPARELWAARCEARARLVAFVREKSEQDRLQRGESLDYVRAAADSFDAEYLTFGFARRLATYKRLSLITYYPERALAIIAGEPPVQFLMAGKAHPLDDPGKAVVQRVFQLKMAERVAARVVFLEDYDLGTARELVAGCDVWVNLPRPPMEASGTSGMKSVLNGGLQLSVLDGWWAEAYDGANGWAISGDPDPDESAKDARDAAAFYDLGQHEIIPLFHQRDAEGIPVAWCDKIKNSILSLGPVFGATRMLEQYATAIYPRG